MQKKKKYQSYIYIANFGIVQLAVCPYSLCNTVSNQYSDHTIGYNPSMSTKLLCHAYSVRVVVFELATFAFNLTIKWQRVAKKEKPSTLVFLDNYSLSCLQTEIRVYDPVTIEKESYKAKKVKEGEIRSR